MTVHAKYVPSPEVAATLGGGGSSGRRRARRVLAALVVLIAAAGGAWFYLAGSPEGNSVRYVTQQIRRGDLTETVTATGTVQPTNKVEISSELSGTVRKVLADYNDHVKAGEVLAVLDTDRLTAAVRRSRAALAVKQAAVQQAEATLLQASQAYDRSKALIEKDIVSRSSSDAAIADYRRAEAGVAVARADVKAAEADLAADETNLRKATIVSPIDGIVMSRSVEAGQTVASSLQAPVLFTIAENLASMQLEVDVDEADVGDVKAGQSASFTVEAYRERRFPAKVTMVRVAPATINGVVTYTAVLTLDNSELLLRPGMTATADIVVKQVKDALLVPNAALRYSPPAEERSASRSGGMMSLLLPRPRGTHVARPAETADGERTIYALVDGKPKPVGLRTGATDGTWTEVLGGSLAAGTAVITGSSAGN